MISSLKRIWEWIHGGTSVRDFFYQNCSFLCWEIVVLKLPVSKVDYESFVDDIHAQIRLLCDVAPSFFKQTKLMGRDYLQLTENCIEKIQHIINEEITRVWTRFGASLFQELRIEIKI